MAQSILRQLFSIISLSWTIPGWNAPDATNWWTFWPSPSAPPSAEPIPGSIPRLFGRSKLAWFQSFLELPHGIPSHDTFGDVFARLDPVQLQNCFISWTQAIAELLPGEVVAIDGKTARRSYDQAAKKGAIHMVSAWATQQSLTLGQVKTDEKSNEITAIPQLLEMLELHGHAS